MEDLSKLSKKELIERLSTKDTAPSANYNDHETEMEKLSRLSDATNPNRLPFSEKNDHKNIMLYTAINKRVGPLHPENARRTMARWKRAGVQLYTFPRSDVQVEAFKETPEYKEYMKKRIADRAKRKAQSSKGRTENMIKSIATEAAKIGAGVK